MAIGASIVADCPVSRLENRSTSLSKRARISSGVDFIKYPRYTDLGETLMKLEIELISDVICPWCFIGKRRFEKALPLIGREVPIEVDWRPFELNPDMPLEGIDRKLYRTRKFGSWERSKALDAQLAEAGASEGIQFAFDRMDRTPSTFEAHRLIWLAGEQNVQGAVVEALFQAYFVDA